MGRTNDGGGVKGTTGLAGMTGITGAVAGSVTGGCLTTASLGTLRNSCSGMMGPALIGSITFGGGCTSRCAERMAS